MFYAETPIIMWHKKAFLIPAKVAGLMWFFVYFPFLVLSGLASQWSDGRLTDNVNSYVLRPQRRLAA